MVATTEKPNALEQAALRRDEGRAEGDGGVRAARTRTSCRASPRWSSTRWRRPLPREPEAEARDPWTTVTNTLTTISGQRPIMIARPQVGRELQGSRGRSVGVHGDACARPHVALPRSPHQPRRSRVSATSAA